MTRPGREPPLRIGVSSCLLGDRVRYDGRDKFDRYVARTLGRYVEFVPVCPEVAIGLGVPRPPIRLTGDARRPRAVGVGDRAFDVTARLAGHGRRMARALGDVSGYIFKSGSPSCGLARVAIHGTTGRRRARGRGVYACAFLAARPLVPAEEETGLADLRQREHFIERVLAYRRWQDLHARGVTPARLADFHSAHRLALLAHGRRTCAALDRLVVRTPRRGVRAAARDYGGRFLAALRAPASRGRHVWVLRYLAGRLRRGLDAADRRELTALIEDYRRARVPRLVVLKRLRRHFRRHPDPEVDTRLYLHPGTAALEMRARQPHKGSTTFARRE